MEALELSHDDLPDFTNFDDVLNIFVEVQRKQLQQESEMEEKKPRPNQTQTSEPQQKNNHITQFKKAFDKIDDGNNFVFIPELYKELSLPKVDFSEVIRTLPSIH